MTEKETIAKILNHFITIAEMQSMEQEKSQLIRNNDYPGANAIYQKQQELAKTMLTLENMKELRNNLNSNENE